MKPIFSTTYETVFSLKVVIFNTSQSTYTQIAYQ